MWVRIERSKRRLLNGLLRLGLPVTTKFEDPDADLGFAFLSSLDVLKESRSSPAL